MTAAVKECAVVDIEEYPLDTPISSLDIDSLELVNIFIELENKLDVHIEGVDLNKVKTINNIVELLQKVC